MCSRRRRDLEEMGSRILRASLISPILASKPGAFQLHFDSRSKSGQARGQRTVLKSACITRGRSAEARWLTKDGKRDGGSIRAYSKWMSRLYSVHGLRTRQAQQALRTR